MIVLCTLMKKLILDLRLNILDKYVDYFVIVESIYTHKGEKRNLKFNIKKFKNLKDKNYILYTIKNHHKLIVPKNRR